MSILDKVKNKAGNAYTSWNQKRAEDKAAWDAAYADQRETLQSEQRETHLSKQAEKARARAEWRYNARGRLGGIIGGVGTAIGGQMSAMKVKAAERRAMNQRRGKKGNTLFGAKMDLGLGSVGRNTDYGFGNMGRSGMSAGLGKTGKMGIGLGPSSLKFGNKKRMRII